MGLLFDGMFACFFCSRVLQRAFFGKGGSLRRGLEGGDVIVVFVLCGTLRCFLLYAGFGFGFFTVGFLERRPNAVAFAHTFTGLFLFRGKRNTKG